MLSETARLAVCCQTFRTAELFRVRPRQQAFSLSGRELLGHVDYEVMSVRHPDLRQGLTILATAVEMLCDFAWRFTRSFSEFRADVVLAGAQLKDLFRNHGWSWMRCKSSTAFTF